MKCPETGMLQAYIDGELGIKARKDIECHLRACAECADALAVLKETDDFVYEMLSVYGKEAAYQSHVHGTRVGGISAGSGNHADSPRKSGYGEIPEKTASAASGIRDVHPVVRQKTMKGVWNFMNRYRKLTTAACIVLVAAACIIIQPVRAAISDALRIFRVDKLEGVRITPQEIARIRESLSSGAGDLTLENLGRIRLTGGLSRTVTRDELIDSCGFDVFIPEYGQAPGPELTVTEPLTLEFALDVEKANRVLDSLNAPEKLPAEIDGKTFTVAFAAQARAEYVAGGKTFTLHETTSPEIAVPAGVDIDSLFNVVVKIPIFPAELKSRLKSVSDWKNVFYLPLFNDSQLDSEEIVLNGTNAYVTTGKDKNGGIHSILIWMKDGIIYGLSADTDKGELLDFAKGLE